MTEFDKRALQVQVRQKVIKRRKILDTIAFIILIPLLLPLLCINKLGELAELIADIIQKPYLHFKWKHLEKYRHKLCKKFIDNN